jgi:hypothetical protein
MMSFREMLVPESTDLLSVQNAVLLLSSGECNLSMLFCFLNSGNQDRLQGGHNHRRVPARDIIAEECNTHNKVDMSLMKQ